MAAVTYQGSTGAKWATSLTLPTHAIGDIIVIYTTSAAAGTIPSVPSAGGTVPTWTSISTDSSSGARLAYTVATATNHTSGTWTNSVDIMAAVLRGQGTTSPVGGSAFSYSTAAAANVIAPSITLNDTSGNSQILHFMVTYRAINTFTWSAAPSGYTSRLSLNGSPASAHGYRLLTKDSTTSDGSVTQGTSANPTEKFSASLEIVASQNAGQFFAMF